MRAFKSSVKPIGYNKYGAVCWANVVLHSLLSLGAFTENILESKFSRVSTSIMRALEGDQNSLEALARSLTDNIHDQQCAHEAYIAILDHIGLDKYFNIESERCIYCAVCKKNTSVVRSKSNYIMTKGFSTVYELFVQAEPSVEYKCDICKSPLQSTKADVTVRRIENIVTVVIDQFLCKSTPSIMHKFSIKTPQGKMLEYSLVALIEHYGSTHGGHYVGYFKRDGKWYYTNDTLVVESAQPTPSNGTYMLFYEFTN